MAAHLDFFRAHAPGFEDAYLLQSAPQLGVRHARRLVGVGLGAAQPVARRPRAAGRDRRLAGLSPKFPNISMPYGALVPEALDGVLACGRHISCDPNSHGFMREIPQCWMTGQAAGVAAALASQGGVAPRAVDIGALQSALLEQGVYLRAGAETEDRQAAEATANDPQAAARAAA